MTHGDLLGVLGQGGRVVGVEMNGAMEGVGLDMIAVEEAIGVEIIGAMEGISVDMIGAEEVIGVEMV